MNLVHPREALFQGQIPINLPVCDHYCGTEQRMKKALIVQAELGPVFDITFDCEDGAPIGGELAHANLVSTLINSPENKFNRVGVRVHEPLSPYFLDDLNTIISTSGKRLAFITIPKIQSSNQVRVLIDQINSISDLHHISKKIPIHVLIETHDALFDVFNIAGLAQVECLSFGLMDFVSAHNGAIPASAMSDDQFKHPLITRAMLEISAACHAHGKIPSHNVCTNIQDNEVIKNDSLIAKNLFGYTRKWSIHPNQINPIVNAFSPSEELIEQSLAILRNAANVNWGPIKYEGKLHDRASYRFYWMILQTAANLGRKFPEVDNLKWFN